MRTVPQRRILNLAVEYSLFLPVGAIAALVWANTFEESYLALALTLRFAVNDVGMVFFFALATKEVVEAIAPGGALHTWRRAAVPVVAAAGGMIGPAVIYLIIVHAFNHPALARGWAIPCATDIAFGYLVVRAIFREHPAVPFLLLLAIADDALGLVILALFYPAGDLHLPAAAALMALAMGASFAIRRRRTISFWPYLVVGGTLAWVALFVGGLHPALALVPIVPFLPHAVRDRGLFVDGPAAPGDTLTRLEHWWKHPVQVILFLFGLVNAGVPVREVGPGTWAVLGAILAGKPLGIVAAAGLSVAAGLHLPQRLGWRDLIVVGCAGAIGFTVALFFATAAFADGPLLDQTKMGALLSVTGALLALGVAWLLGVGRFRGQASGHGLQASGSQRSS